MCAPEMISSLAFNIKQPFQCMLNQLTEHEVFLLIAAAVASSKIVASFTSMHVLPTPGPYGSA